MGAFHAMCPQHIFSPTSQQHKHGLLGPPIPFTWSAQAPMGAI